MIRLDTRDAGFEAAFEALLGAGRVHAIGWGSLEKD